VIPLVTVEDVFYGKVIPSCTITEASTNTSLVVERNTWKAFYTIFGSPGTKDTIFAISIDSRENPGFLGKLSGFT